VKDLKESESLSNLENSVDLLLLKFIIKIEPGQEIRTSLQEYGIRLGKAIRECIELQGLEPNLNDFIEKYGASCFCHYKTCVAQSGINQFRIIHCPTDSYCRMSQGIELGNLLCQLDLAVIQGFAPELEAKIDSSMKIGSKNYWFESEISLPTH